MGLHLLNAEFQIERDETRCIACQVCVRQCANDAHTYDPEDDRVTSNEARCVGCHRCATLCPTRALTIRRTLNEFRPNANWTSAIINNVYKQAETGGVLLAGMGCDQPYPIYWDHILLNASQVTNPSIDPLREPMELRTYLGRKPDRLEPEDVFVLADRCLEADYHLQRRLATNLILHSLAHDLGTVLNRRR